jgi:hypothetical protein
VSGLFESLATRFIASAPPAIRPRPAARFEGDSAGDGLREEQGERISSAPLMKVDAPPAPPTVPDAIARHASFAVAEAAEPGPLPSSADTVSPRAGSAALEWNTAPPEPGGPDDMPLAAEASEPRPASVSMVPEAMAGDPNPAPPRETGIPSRVAEAPPETVPAVTERIIETRREVLRSSPEAPPVNAGVQGESASTAPRLRDEAPVVRIGRIEVTRPAPVAAASPVPAREAPAQAGPRHAPSRGSARSSGLTDYLGWKKR